MAGGLGEFQGGDEIGLRDFVGGTFVHDHVGLVADIDEVEVGLGLLFVGGVHQELTGDAGDTDGAERSIPRNVGNGQRGRSSEDGEDVGVILAVGREQQRLDLDFIVPALGEERADGAIGQAAGEDLLLGGTTFTLEVTAGVTASGRCLFAVIHGEGEEILTRLGLGGRNSCGEDDGFAELNGDGAVGLLCKAAGFDGDVLATNGDLNGMGHTSGCPTALRNFTRSPPIPSWDRRVVLGERVKFPGRTGRFFLTSLTRLLGFCAGDVARASNVRGTRNCPLWTMGTILWSRQSWPAGCPKAKTGLEARFREKITSGA